MSEKIFIGVVIFIFIYLVYQQYIFQKGLFFGSIESFTPQQVENIIQQPGSVSIGKSSGKINSVTQLLSVSNGYNKKTIDSLKPSNPEPYDNENKNESDNFPSSVKEQYPLKTSQFEYPNHYNFTVEYPCRKTATGMFSDCGVWSADTAWTADPYKGLNCRLYDTKTPLINNNTSSNRETEYNNP